MRRAGGRTGERALGARGWLLDAGSALGMALGLCLVLGLAPAAPARAAEPTVPQLLGATALTEVFGDGQKLTAVAVEYDREIDGARLSPAAFKVDGRSVVQARVQAFAAGTTPGDRGRFVVLDLSPDDAAAALYQAQGRGVVRRAPRASVSQVAEVWTASGEAVVPVAGAAPVETRRVINRIVDDFVALEFADPQTGDRLKYNLFIPRDIDPDRTYPLVLFMHDAGATSAVGNTTLVQGLGAVAWASPGDQAVRPAFVLAPQYDQPVVNDRSEATSQLDTTVHLVESIVATYRVDRSRLYATGQSGGAMMAIAMNIKYPDLFAASFIVAGQWDPARVKPLAADKLWIVVSQGDVKAFPGQNAIAAELEKAGAGVSRAVWDGRATPAGFTSAVRRMAAEGNPINYAALRQGTVVPAGQSDDGGSNHVNTWRIAYAIEGIREWVFKQRR